MLPIWGRVFEDGTRHGALIVKIRALRRFGLSLHQGVVLEEAVDTHRHPI